MNNMYFWFGMMVVLFIAIFAALELGRRYYFWQARKNPSVTQHSVQTIEGALFALMGLLVAFTFASANVKLDARRLSIVDEANTISTAYQRLDMLPSPQRISLQNDFKDYLDSRLTIYNKMMDYSAEQADIIKSQKIQKIVWEKAVSLCKAQSNPTTCMLILPPINNMFDLANKRLSYIQLHPPTIVFFLLICVALISALLSGYSISFSKNRSILHIFCYAVIMVIALYVIIDMEFPRYGFIRENAFDSTLLSVRNNM